MAEDDGRGIGEPSPQSYGPTGGVTAVVHHRNRATADVDLEPLRQHHPAVVVAEHGVDGSERSQDFEHRRVRDVAGVQDHVCSFEVTAQLVHEFVGSSRTEVRVGDQQHVQGRTHTGHGTGCRFGG